MVAPDRVMVGDRAAIRNHGIKRGLMVCHCALNSLCRPAAWKVKYGAGPSGYPWVQRQVTSPGRPVASTMERSVAALTLSWNDSNRSQVIAV
jgi:hypothetical protein